MNAAEKARIRQHAADLIRYSFPLIRAEAGQAGKHLAAYYFALVDDFFAAADNAITHEDMQAFDPDSTLLGAIWDGRCKLYEGSYRAVDPHAGAWPDNQSALYKETWLLAEQAADDEAQYQTLRRDFETCLLEALAQCDAEGLFGDRREDGLLLFAFYIDDYDGNGKKSLLRRSAEQLNPAEARDKLK